MKTHCGTQKNAADILFYDSSCFQLFSHFFSIFEKTPTFFVNRRYQFLNRYRMGYIYQEIIVIGIENQNNIHLKGSEGPFS